MKRAISMVVAPAVFGLGVGILRLSRGCGTPETRIAEFTPECF